MKFIENEQVRVMENGLVWTKLPFGAAATRGLHTELLPDGSYQEVQENTFVTTDMVVADKCYQLPQGVETILDQDFTNTEPFEE